MPIINKFPLGGGGASSGSSAELNIFTQPNEPTKKDGIWIKTSNQYEKIIIDNQHLINFNGSGVWSKSPFPIKPQYKYSYFTACMFNGKLHVFTSQYHYEYDDSTGVYVQLANDNTRVAGATRKHIVFNGILYGLLEGNTGSDADNCNYMSKYNASNNTWSSIYTPTSTSYSSDAAVLNNILYLTINGKFYKMSTDDTFTEAYMSNDNIIGGYSFISNNGRIDMFDYNNGYTYHEYIENDTKYTLNKPPIHSAAILYNGVIHLLSNYRDSTSGGSGNEYTTHYIWNKSSDTYTDIGKLYDYGNANKKTLYTKNNYLAYIGSIYTSASNDTSYYLYKYTTPENVYDSQTLIIQKGYTNDGKYITNIADTSAIEGDGANNRFPSGFDDCFYFADSAFDWDAPMYYGDGTQWIKFKN